MNGSESMQDSPFDESTDVTKCIVNSLGLIRMGAASPEEINELIEKRVDVGKRGRSRFGRLICVSEGCTAACNVEIVDGKPTERNITQALELLNHCSILQACII